MAVWVTWLGPVPACTMAGVLSGICCAGSLRSALVLVTGSHRLPLDWLGDRASGCFGRLGARSKRIVHVGCCCGSYFWSVLDPVPSVRRAVDRGRGCKTRH